MNITNSYKWEKLRANLWLLPALMMLLTVGLFCVTMAIDQNLDYKWKTNLFSIWKGGAIGSIRTLSTIAGSMITITGVVFSITLVSISLTASQFGSKILRNFVRDRSTQIVLGTFISTSIYCLLVLKTMQTQDQAFVPDVSIAVSVALAFTSLCLLIYYIHHLSQILQASEIISRVGKELISLIQCSLFPYEAIKKEPVKKPLINHSSQGIVSETYGFLQIIDYDRLMKLGKENQLTIMLHFRPGNFINYGDTLAYVSKPELPEAILKKIRKAFVIGRGKSPTQDIEFAIEQLVGIAIRALGMSSNDTFAANSCVDHLGAALCLLCKKELNPPYYTTNDYVYLDSKRVTFEGLVDASFYQIRQYGAKIPPILIHLLETLNTIISHTLSVEQLNALKKHALIIHNTGKQNLEENDYRDLEKRFNLFMKNWEQHLTSKVSFKQLDQPESSKTVP